VGAQYSRKINKDNYLSVGVIYDFKSDVKTKRLQTLEIRNFADIVLSSDTLVDNAIGAMTLPSTIGFGASIGTPLKWLAGIDVRIQPWSNFKDFNNSSVSLQNAMSVAIGGEYTPDAGSIDKILSRMTYRIGASYEKTPYVIEDSGVNDFGINFGSSVPVGISSLDMGFRFGKRGSISSNQIKENYFRMQIGLTFNDRLWFIKRKFD
jgi:long-subunit fatty acid transport protein